MAASVLPPHGFLFHEKEAVEPLTPGGNLLDAALERHVRKILVTLRPGRPACRWDDFCQTHGSDFFLVFGDEVLERPIHVIDRGIQHRDLQGAL
jgi:hypothetical protein